MVDAALCEMEGVLFDTARLRRDCLARALRAQGLDGAMDPDTVDGLSPRAAVAAHAANAGFAHDDALIDLVATRAQLLFSTDLATGGAQLTNGAREFVDLAAGSVRIAFVTRALRADAQTLLRLSGLETAPAFMVCADDVFDGKPAPEGYRQALQRLHQTAGVTPSAVLAIEDGAAGIRSARDAGIRCVVTGSTPPHVAVEANACIDSLIGASLRDLDMLSSSAGRGVT